MQITLGVSGISIVIPNYNGCELLPAIIPSLKNAAEETGLPFEIIISDDCSTDDSVTLIKSAYPFIQLLQNDVNAGFSPTINKGIFAAQYSHVLLLNSDVKLTPGYFGHLFRYFEKADTFGVMSRIVGWDDDIIQDGAKYPSFHGVKIKTSGNYIPLEPEKEQWLYSMYLSGANAFIDRSKLIALQGFDELFAPFYVEDYELSMRAWRMGWKCYYDHTAFCRHQVSTSIKSSNKKKKINAIYNRNKMYLHALHLSNGKRLLWFLQLIPEGIINLVTVKWNWFLSLRMFISTYKDVKKSRDQFVKLAGEKKLLGSSEVAAMVLSSIEGKQIKRF
jgi:GT2 family glycosyltransferase